MKIENAHSIMVGGYRNREEERALLERSAALVQKRNENVRRFETPETPKERNRIEGADAGLHREALTTGVTPPYEVTLSPRARLEAAPGKNPVPMAEEGVPAAKYTPVTELRTEHYAWTEKDGIVETVTAAQELAAHREQFRQEMIRGISLSIGDILEPRESYEEAYEELYNEERGGSWWTFNEETGGFTVRANVTTVQGAFGAFANRLNNYLDQFGAEDGYFDALEKALNELDPEGGDELVNQLRRMVDTVRGGQAIDTGSETFQEEVQKAIADAYGPGKEQKKAGRAKDYEEKDEPTAAGLSWLDMERQKAREEKDLLDKFTGREQDGGFASAGETLDRQRSEKPQEDGRRERLQRLEREEKPEEAPDPFLAVRKQQKSGTRLREEDRARRQAIYEGWDAVSERRGWGAVIVSVPVASPEDEAFLRELNARGEGRQ